MNSAVKTLLVDSYDAITSRKAISAAGLETARVHN